MVPKQRPRAAESWAYAYQLNPPQPEPRFAKIKMLLRRARLAAQRAGRLWTGQVVKDAHITHILVVTDAPDEAHAVDRAIDAELSRCAMALLSKPSVISCMTSCSRFVIRTASAASGRRCTTASRAMCDRSVPVRTAGITSDPRATDRTVPTRSSTVASFMMNPLAPALT